MSRRQEKKAPTSGFGWLPQPLVSEIARRALKKIISDGEPAIPPIYEKAFFNMAFQMGESELVSRMMPDLPTGQASLSTAKRWRVSRAILKTWLRRRSGPSS